MKKVTILLFVLCCVASLAGCKSTSAAPKPSASVADAFVFTYNDISIAMNADAAPVIDALGEPKSCTEQASCAFEGMEKTYSYGSFSITTYPNDGKDCISGLWFTDDQVATEEGVRIGDPQSKVEQIYKPEELCGCNAYILTRGETMLSIFVTDGVVSSIQYNAVL